MESVNGDAMTQLSLPLHKNSPRRPNTPSRHESPFQRQGTHTDKSKIKDFNPVDFLDNLILDPNDPGYVDLRELNIHEIIAKHPITTFYQRKKVMDKI